MWMLSKTILQIIFLKQGQKNKPKEKLFSQHNTFQKNMNLTLFDKLQQHSVRHPMIIVIFFFLKVSFAFLRFRKVGPSLWDARLECLVLLVWYSLAGPCSLHSDTDLDCCTCPLAWSHMRRSSVRSSAPVKHRGKILSDEIQDVEDDNNTSVWAVHFWQLYNELELRWKTGCRLVITILIQEPRITMEWNSNKSM